MIALDSGRGKVALHTLRDRPGTALLCLHALGSSHREYAGIADDWPGPVTALDFAGHGDSDCVRGRAYTAEELWVADADAALAHLGSACLVGAGMGAWVALLLAGARPGKVPAALLLDGAGLAGGGEAPELARLPEDRAAFTRDRAAASGAPDARPDPLVFEAGRHPHPSAFARPFAERARRLLLFEPDGAPTAGWWHAVAEAPGAERFAGTLPDALTALRSAGEA